ncbi:protein-tyrosine phosphatase-like protein [Paraphysoderma sedebokerense]|nr:protein-tyrosine phosphatase-like protein [Paraphysoderma sedebokerense]
MRQYISTQGPLPNTFGDFWAMILQEKSRAIVMVTLEEERGMRKCDRYFPTSEQPNSAYTRPNSTSIHLNLLSEFRFNASPVPSTFESTFRDAYIKYLRKRYPGIHNDGIRKLLTGLSNVFLRQIRIVRTIAGVAPENWQDGIESWVTYQLQFLGWPDHGVPEDPAEVVSLMEVVEFVRSGAADVEFNTGVVGCTKEGPTVVHCSAGVGRSGTFITVDYVCSEIWRTILSSPNDLNAIKDDIILSTVKWLRTCRVSMVQSVDQFKLCYKGLLCYLDSVCSSSPAEL